MILSIFHAPSKKEDNSRNSMGVSVRSTFQKVQRINELEILYASFMLSLRYHLCDFETDYTSAKNQYYVRGFMLLIFFHTHSKKNEYPRNRMGNSVRSTFQKVQRIHELEFPYASFMLSLRYHLCGFYTDYASTKKSPKRLCYVNTMLLRLVMILCCYGSQYLLCFYEETLSSYCYTFTRTYIFKGLVTLLNFRKHMNMIF